ncbi:protein NRT1/ PTR FAMILY 5.6-like isoform X2 [Magnolia sinica]|uniref:protein NRT1/ PTR FAMILY 5.6-like isoform X2 n=1 Tax=Magnolia sinica TaxID=86752 RepID=UPI0026589065|nr:protein NRT1/ PTR FAMILY 5.6-like isoform X2 [Magnolia sinica]
MPTIGLIFSDAIVGNAIMGNLMFILRRGLGKNMARNAIVFAIQMSFTSLMAIAGSFVADAYFGKYRMIMISTIIYIIALVIISCLIWIAAAYSVYVACLLMATGQGCFQSLLENYGEDQINAYYEGKNIAKVLHQIWWWTSSFLGMAVGSIILLCAEEYGWRYSCWVIVGVMVVAFILFWCGKSSYDLKYDKSPKSPLTRVIRVFVAATLNRHLDCPTDKTHLHENPEEEHNDLLPHTDSLRCLDKAAIRPSNQDANKNTIPPSQQDTEKNQEEKKETEKINWRLCRVTEVEENKLLLGVFPIWATLVMCGTVLSMQKTLFIEQAYHMDRRFGSILIPVTSLFLLPGLSKAAIYAVHFLPLDRITILGQELIPKSQIGLGMFSSILCCMTAALVEKRRLNTYKGCDLGVNCHLLHQMYEGFGYGDIRMSIFWLFPQFFLIGAMDGFVSCGIKDFFNDYFPSMKSFEYSFSQSVLAAGYFLFALLALIISKATSWFGKNMNRSRADYFYWGLGILSFINLCIYAYISQRFSSVKKCKEIMEKEPNIGNSNKTRNDNGNNNDNSEVTTSAEERTPAIEIAIVKQQEMGTHVTSSEHV